MHNTNISFLKMLKIYLQLRNALIKFNIKSIIVLKVETKNLIKYRLGKNLLYLLIGKTHENLL